MAWSRFRAGSSGAASCRIWSGLSKESRAWSGVENRLAYDLDDRDADRLMTSVSDA
jgi:hypothetical protein